VKRTRGNRWPEAIRLYIYYVSIWYYYIYYIIHRCLRWTYITRYYCSARKLYDILYTHNEAPGATTTTTTTTSKTAALLLLSSRYIIIAYSRLVFWYNDIYIYIYIHYVSGYCGCPSHYTKPTAYLYVRIVLLWNASPAGRSSPYSLWYDIGYVAGFRLNVNNT